ncbi:PD40 domain-containing protein [bacterium]|nr:PD40 domain-containing protein [bacterium]
MTYRIILLLALTSSLLFAEEPLHGTMISTSPPDSLWYEGELHIQNVKQLTFGGENAEAYFSTDGKFLVYQSTRDSFDCDQIFTYNLETGEQTLVSTGTGVTTCSFFVPGKDELVFCSTHEHGAHCPEKPDRSLGYVWGLFDFGVYKCKLDGSGLTKLSDVAGAYDAEAAVSPDGKEVIFTSGRDGDLELYKMDIDGRNVKRLTHTVGYDGGPFFSPDGKWIVYRTFHPKTPEEFEKWNFLWEKQAVSPVRLELWVMDTEGEQQRQVTNLNSASFCPYMHPNGEWIIFTTNWADSLGNKRMPNFDLFRTRPDGSGLERITYGSTFDGFPMWSYDGKKLVWASNRGVRKELGETNIFIADWVE